MQKAYKDLKFKPESYPLARQLADKIISLPIGPHLNNQSVRKIINVIKDA
jgi:dTDP-4-amino-4,6-dideoxygalactose transaminase